MTENGITAFKGNIADLTQVIAFDLNNSGNLTLTDGLNANMKVVCLDSLFLPPVSSHAL